MFHDNLRTNALPSVRTRAGNMQRQPVMFPWDLLRLYRVSDFDLFILLSFCMSAVRERKEQQAGHDKIMKSAKKPYGSTAETDACPFCCVCRRLPLATFTIYRMYRFFPVIVGTIVSISDDVCFYRPVFIDVPSIGSTAVVITGFRSGYPRRVSFGANKSRPLGKPKVLGVFLGFSKKKISRPRAAHEPGANPKRGSSLPRENKNTLNPAENNDDGRVVKTVAGYRCTRTALLLSLLFTRNGRVHEEQGRIARVYQRHHVIGSTRT